MSDMNIGTTSGGVHGGDAASEIQGGASVSKAKLQQLQLYLDTISGQEGKAEGKKVPKSNSPDPALARLILWLNMEGPGSLDDYAGHVEVDAFLKTIEIKYQEIVLQVLDAWSKQVAEDAKRVREYLKSDEYMRLQELKSAPYQASQELRQVEAGIKSASAQEQWFKSLTPAERTSYEALSGQILYLERRYDFDKFLGKHIDTISNQVSATGGVVSGGLGQQISITGAMVTQLQSTDPMAAARGAVDAVSAASEKIFPSYAVDLSMVIASTTLISVNLAIAQTLGVAATEGGDPKQVVNKFTKNYAEQVLKTINSDEFPNIVMAIMSHKMEGHEPMNREQLKKAIDKASILYLAASIALLYKMSSSYHGEGGGVTGQELMDIIRGKLDGGPGTKELLVELDNRMAGIPEQEAEDLLADFADSLNSSTPIALLADPKKVLESFYGNKSDILVQG